MTAERLRDHGALPWLDVVESFDGLVRRGVPGSRTEYLLQSLGAWCEAGERPETHPLARDGLGRGLRAARARAFDAASAYTGFIDPDAALVPGAAHPTSPTALQDWAACPFRYFLGRVLRLRDVPRPEATEAISALEEGALIHGILEDFLRDGPQLTDPTTRWTDADRERLDGLVDAHCADAEARGVTGRRVSWILARRRIRTTARRFLGVDEWVRARFGVVPAPDGLERAFGDPGQVPVAVDLPDGRTVHFRGRIDRVDRSPAGDRAVVYDYKTGSSTWYAATDDDPVDAGRALQLPVYALAARAQEGVADATACYWFTREEEPDEALLELDLEAAEERFVGVVGTVVDGIAGGCFPGFPGEPAWDHRALRDAWSMCKWCDFDRLCPVDRGSLWERVEADPASAPFRALDPSAEEDPS
jgi:RecB family exonuclease